MKRQSDPRIRAGALALHELRKLRTILDREVNRADRDRERMSDLFGQVDEVIRECEAIASDKEVSNE